MESISIPYPFYYIVICLTLGAIYAFLHYYRSKDFEDNLALKSSLAFIRGTIITAICLLLLNPLIKTIFEEIKPPLIVIGQDISSSISEVYDQQELTQYQQNFEQLNSQLTEKYTVDRYGLGSTLMDSIPKKFDSKETNLSNLQTKLNDEYSHRNVGAVIMASDGLYNKGQNPVYISNKLNVPIHTILLGDTTIPKDVVVQNIFTNEVAYLEDRFPVQVDLRANFSSGDQSKVRLQKMVNGEFNTIAEKSVSYQGDYSFQTIEFIVDAQQVGVQRYRVLVTSVSNESNKANNRRDFFIEVLDSRQKVLIVNHAPHPDISALKAILGSNKNYEFEVVKPEESIDKLKSVDLLIFHNLPSSRHNIKELLNKANSLKLPRLFIVGNQTNLNKLNEMQNCITIAGNNNSSNEVQVNFSDNFQLFKSDKTVLSDLEQYPPLICPFGDYNTQPGAFVLATQQINRVNTDYPVMSFSSQSGIKEGIISGTGIWKWRLFNYLKNESHTTVDGFLQKCIQYLTVKENRDKFRLKALKNIYAENENVIFSAELYNNSFEAVTDPEVQISIKNSGGEKFDFTFSREDRSYYLNAGKLPPGNYDYQANTQYGGETHTKRGQFTIQEIQVETYNLVANHQLLRALSQSTGGKSYYPHEMDLLGQALLQNNNLKDQVYYTSRSKSAINLRWILFGLILLLCLEWFLRRYFGRY